MPIGLYWGGGSQGGGPRGAVAGYGQGNGFNWNGKGLGNMRYAIYKGQYAVCNMQYAIGSVQLSMPGRQSPLGFR